jgi:hypothetical protein
VAVSAATAPEISPDRQSGRYNPSSRLTIPEGVEVVGYP